MVAEPLKALILTFALVGCGTGPSQFTPAATASAPLGSTARGVMKSICQAFSANFDELVACRRANGTLESFFEEKITWRVRYFVRYQEMPCNEAPTVKEGYVFHMVTDDLYSDPDLDSVQRLAIRNAMFGGKVRCRGGPEQQTGFAP